MLPLLSSLLSLLLLCEAHIFPLTCTNTSYYSEVEYLDPGTTCCQTYIGDPVCDTRLETVCIHTTQTVCTASITTECYQADCPLTLIVTCTPEVSEVSREMSP